MSVRLVHVADDTLHVTGTARSTRGELLTDMNGTPGPAIHPSAHPLLWHALVHAAHAPGVRIDEGAHGADLEVAGNPTDAALRVLALKGGVTAAYSPDLKHELPFSSCRKIGTVVAEVDGKPLALVRGAPEIIVDRYVAVLTADGEQPMDESQRSQWLDLAVSWGARAMRVVALAQREDIAARNGAAEAKVDLEQRLTLIGLVGIVDPPRPEVKSAIAEAHSAGISTMMITGDQPATARAIAEELDLCEPGAAQVITGPQIDLLDQKELEARVEHLDVVARATPTHKLRIVEALKARGLVCAMTGDGVNDAPAVKAASIGVAMGRAGTEVTKDAADLVLADDNYATIVAAVEEGRSIFNNIKKFIFFLLSSNTGIVLAVFSGGLLGWAPPLAPIQILWINLVTNGLPALALGVEPTEPRLMQRPPRDAGRAILGKQEYWMMLAVGSIMAVGALGVFSWLIGDPLDRQSPTFPLAQTGCFAVLSLSPMFHAFNCRSARVSNWRIGWFSNWPLWGAVTIGLALIAVAIYVPALHPVFRTDRLTVAHLIPITLVSAIPLLVVEPYKLYLGRAHRRQTGR
jgi:Ca2+-transporting ATPase